MKMTMRLPTETKAALVAALARGLATLLEPQQRAHVLAELERREAGQRAAQAREAAALQARAAELLRLARPEGPMQ